MTASTVGGTTTTYAYDGSDVRVSTTTSSVTTPYIWDRSCTGGSCGTCGGPSANVAHLIDDGANGYLHADGVLAELPASGSTRDYLADGLGSIRGISDSTGSLVATADYDVFGAVRTNSGTQSTFRFSGERSDPTTGFTYLRARYLDPATGRLISADTVQPNAPGTQGWNLYAYVANNPTTWADPTGHSSWAPAAPRGPSAGGGAGSGYAAALTLVAAGVRCKVLRR